MVLVHCPRTNNVLAMYWVSTPPLAPSEWQCNMLNESSNDWIVQEESPDQTIPSSTTRSTSCKQRISTAHQNDNEHNVPIQVPVSTKMVTSMNGGGIDQVDHPQVTVRLPLGHGVEVLSPFLNLVPGRIRMCVPTSHGQEGRPHIRPGNSLGRVIAEGGISDSSRSGGRHLAVRSKRI